ncbi:MAG: dihydrolipoyl dehydrogenase [Desulfobacterales bacterium]
MYDVIVIGGGPGGYAAGIRASQLGGKTAILEPAQMGGTCVNRGCIPAKIWNRAARMKRTIEHAGDFGIQAAVNGVDLETIVKRRKGVPEDIQMGMKGLCKNNKIDVIAEYGRLKGPGEVQAGETVLNTKSIIIATGTAIHMPDIPGLDDAAAMTTDHVLEMTAVPSSVLVIGAGPIEVEMALILNAFGAKVTMISESPRALPAEDGTVSQRVTMAIREQGIEFLPRYTLGAVKKGKAGYTAELAGSEAKTVEVEKVLVSSRKPNVDIGLDRAGVELNDNGFIAVDDTLKTSSDHIYAIGDITGSWQLSYAATCMGVAAAENAMGGSRTYNASLAPRGLWSIPEAASVGITEEEADDQDLEVEIGECPVSVNGVAMAYGETEGMVKVISDAEYGEILGVHIVGSNAVELIWGASLAMQMEATVEDLAYCMAVHPTFSETIPMAGQDAQGWALYLPRRRK